MQRRRYIFLLIAALLLGACGTPQRNTAEGQVVVHSPATPFVAPSPTAGMPVAAVALVEATAFPSRPPASCAVTQPPNPPFTPPGPKPPKLWEGNAWYGTNALWTTVPQNGTWSDLPHNPEGYTQKVWWWREGYSWTGEPSPALTVTGRRLDVAAPPLNVSQATNGYGEDIQSAMLVGVDFPTLGCWEITGKYGGQELRFVVWVAP